MGTVPKKGYRFVAFVREVQSRGADLTVERRTSAHVTFAEESGGAKTIDSIAVLPFVNASADPNTEYLSDGITESIINSLSQLQKLRVMARSTVFRYKGRQVDAAEVGRELKVGTVLSGRVLQFGDHLIVRTELVDTAAGCQLWGEQYNRKPSDILAVQEEIAREITQI